MLPVSAMTTLPEASTVTARSGELALESPHRCRPSSRQSRRRRSCRCPLAVMDWPEKVPGWRARRVRLFEVSAMAMAPDGATAIPGPVELGLVAAPLSPEEPAVPSPAMV